jgi:hypothetical protein
MSQTTKMLQAGCFLATNSLCFRSLDEIKDSFHRISNSLFSKGQKHDFLKDRDQGVSCFEFK